MIKFLIRARKVDAYFKLVSTSEAWIAKEVSRLEKLGFEVKVITMVKGGIYR